MSTPIFSHSRARRRAQAARGLGGGLLALCLVAGRAHAREDHAQGGAVRLLLVVPSGGTPSARDQAGRLLSPLKAALDRQPGLWAVLPGGGTGPELRPPADEALASALADAQVRMKRGDFAGAGTRLARAIINAERAPRALDAQGLQRAILLFGLSQFRLGDKASADTALVELYRLFPDNAAEQERFPPVFREALRRARLSAQALPRGRLEVIGAQGAPLQVDGEGVGALPYRGTLPQGRHFLFAARGSATAAKAVEVRAGAVTRVGLALPAGAERGGPRFVLRRLLGAGERALLERECTGRGAWYALLVWLTLGEDASATLHPALYSVGQGGFMPLTPVALPSPALLGQAVDAVAGEAAEAARSGASFESVPFDLARAPPAYSGMAAAGASPGLVRQAAAEEPPPRTLVLKPSPGLERNPALSLPQAEGGRAPTEVRGDARGVPWWIWLVGGAALAGAGAATYAVVSSSHQAVTGTVKASW